MPDEPKPPAVAALHHQKHATGETWGYHCPHCGRAGAVWKLGEAQCHWCGGKCNVAAPENAVSQG